jgi:hypothetical protein
MLVSNKTLSTPNFYVWKWITGELDETATSVGIHSSGRPAVLSMLMAYRVLETAHMVYGSSFTKHASVSNSVNKPRDVMKMVDLVKKLVSHAVHTFNLKRSS